jgi:hypothetical protein
MRTLFYILLASTTLAGKSFAQECRCKSIENSVESVYEVDTASGRHMKLRFEADPVTRQTTLGFLCVNPDTAVSQARLWIPEHGHGSSPTRLVAAGNACTRIERVNFVMTGLWEIRVRLSDNDAGTFSVDVVNP